MSKITKQIKEEASLKQWLNVLTIMIYLVCYYGHFHEYEKCPCQEHADELFKDICDIEKKLHAFFETKTLEIQQKEKKNTCPYFNVRVYLEKQLQNDFVKIGLITLNLSRPP